MADDEGFLADTTDFLVLVFSVISVPSVVKVFGCRRARNQRFNTEYAEKSHRGSQRGQGAVR